MLITENPKIIKSRFPPTVRPMPEFATNPSNSLLRYDWLFAAVHHAKHGKADADAEKGECRGLRNRGGCRGSQKAVLTHAVGKSPDDLSRIINAIGERLGCARHIDLGEDPTGVEETVLARAVAKNPDDLPRVVDAESRRKGCARH